MAAWLALSYAVGAQPLIQLPEGDFTCSVEVVQKVQPAPGVESLPVEKKRVITKIGNVRRDEVVWADNSVLQAWMLHKEGLAVTEQKGSDGKVKPFVLTGTSMDSICPKLLRLNTDSLSWVTPAALAEKAEPGVPLHYRAVIETPAAPSEVPGAPDTPARSVVYQAWVDAKTGLPLRLDDGEATYVLTFGKERPVGPLTMPEHLAAELQRWSTALATHSHL